MKTTWLILMTLLNSLLLSAQDTTKVLFIGNSITFYNNMPQTFEAIANSKGDATEVTMYAPGGTGFINHVNDQNVYNHFQQGGWDYVVLQPGSNESPGYSEPIDQTLSRARKLQDSIIQYSPCAKILYYEISYGVWGNTPADLNTYNATMDLIRTNLTYLSDSTELFFAPAGEAMRTAWNDDQTTMLWGGNGDIHPNVRGSYIIACSFYASIFQKPSFGTNSISSLTLAEAISCQQLADTVVLNNFSDWRINTFNQHTDFDYAVNQSSSAFTSTSQNIDSLSWDFGDGNSSNISDPVHNYAQTGAYTVTLTTYKDGCVETKTEDISISAAELDVIDTTPTVAIYPNPFERELSFESDTPGLLTVHDIFGSSVAEQEVNVGVNAINLSDSPRGTYFFVLKDEDGVIRSVAKGVKN